jgi:RNA polymerase sigma factor (sigma-70 family)
LSKHVYFKVAKLEDAQDIVQEIYIDFYKYISSKGKKVDNVQAYLIQIANNKLSLYYKDKTFETTLIKDEYLLESIEDENDLEFNVLERSTLDEIWNEVKTLSDLDQHILIDYYRFGLNFREISERYQIPESTIKSRCQNAIRQLRDKFK